MLTEERWLDVQNVSAVRVKTFQALVKTLPPKLETLLDLGAGACIFAQHARNAGYRVTAVDARTDRVPNEFEMRGITFVEADVRKFDVGGFDVIANLGLLHHLTLADQEDLLRRCAHATVILETQVHIDDLVPAAARPWAEKRVREGDYEGVLYPETPNGVGAIDHETSFWHTEPSLLRMFRNCGYAKVTSIEPLYVEKYGPRKFYLLEGEGPR